VVHEWWGHNDYARKRAEMLAKLGYVALAVDMYGSGRQASHPDEAGKFAGAVAGNMPVAKARFKAAIDTLKAQQTVNSHNIAAIGYCFGGGIVLNMARQGVDLKAVVSFHGSLATQNPAERGNIKAKIRVFNGAADPLVKAEHIEAFKKEMKRAGADYELVNYPGAKHAFTNPHADQLGAKFSLPLAYQKQADEDSWRRMQVFFKQVFQ
jgi:dienelactone hydrolase